MRIQREEFRKDLLQSVSAVRMCVTQIQNDQKQLKLTPKKAEVIKSRIKEKCNEVSCLIEDVKSTFAEV
jgi:hypothetical protein